MIDLNKNSNSRTQFSLGLTLIPILLFTSVVFCSVAIAQNIDSDSDGVIDAQELRDGTNPFDSGSFASSLAGGFCSDWNSSFNGAMFNISEFVNFAKKPLEVKSTLLNLYGNQVRTVSNYVHPRGQTDLLVHDIQGQRLNSYGQVCHVVSKGDESLIDGRTVFYFPSKASKGLGRFDFAFSMPFTKGLKGEQFVGINTFQPSFDPLDQNNLVANWIQVTNSGRTNEKGKLYFYGMDGTLIAEVGLGLAAGDRDDVPGHIYGNNIVGLVQWRPENPNAVFSIKNVRYLYDRSSDLSGFDSAYQLSGMKGSGQKLLVPIDTREGSSILEVSNTLNRKTSVNVSVFNLAGEFVQSYRLLLPAFGSQHLILDQILPLSIGHVAVEGEAAGSTLAVAMQYGRTQLGGISYVYGSYAREPLRKDMHGSYNTFIGQGCRLQLINALNRPQNIYYGLTRSDGIETVVRSPVWLPARGTAEIHICENEVPNTYGIVTVEADKPGALFSQIVRTGAWDDYRFSTLVR